MYLQGRKHCVVKNTKIQILEMGLSLKNFTHAHLFKNGALKKWGFFHFRNLENLHEVAKWGPIFLRGYCIFRIYRAPIDFEGLKIVFLNLSHQVGSTHLA